MKKILLFSTIILIIFLGSLAGYFYLWFDRPVFGKEEVAEYYVPKGTSFKKIVYDLSKQKIITYPKLFIIYSVFTNKAKYIKYGTYRFVGMDTPKTILSKLIHGETALIKITLPEGLNIFQVAERLEKYYPMVIKEQWLSLFSDQNNIQYLGLVTGVKNIEGFIFPQTYFFDPHPEPEYIIKAILTEFKKNVTPLMFEKAKSMGLNPLQFITLASIIEKETSLKVERNRVSAVYWNRIKMRMKLQADPTVIYGIWNRYLGALTRKDLLTPTLYNTYTSYGLPIGPIASPGIDSILATLNPANTKDIYFVANGLGGHTFSKNLSDHNRAVQHYIRLLRERSHR